MPAAAPNKTGKESGRQPSSVARNKSEKATDSSPFSSLNSIDLTPSGAIKDSSNDIDLTTNNIPEIQPTGESQARPPNFVQRLANRVPCLGIMFALCASVFLGTAGMLVKMTTSISGIQVAVFRSNEMVPVMGRALLGASSITFSYYALKLIPLGDATTIRFSLPIWTLIVSYLVLNESCDLFKIGAVTISILGVAMIAKPDSCVHLLHLLLRALNLEAQQQQNLAEDASTLSAITDSSSMSAIPPAYLMLEEGAGEDTIESEPDPKDIPVGQQLEGSLLALASSICLSMSLIFTRLCKHTPTEVIVTWLSILSIVIGTTTLLLIGEWRLPDNLNDVMLIFLNGACGSAGQWFITSALKVEQSGVIALARTFDIEVAFLYSALLLHEKIRATSVIGSILVSCGVISVVVPKWLESRKRTPLQSESAAKSTGPV